MAIASIIHPALFVLIVLIIEMYFFISGKVPRCCVQDGSSRADWRPPQEDCEVRAFAGVLACCVFGSDFRLQT